MPLILRVPTDFRKPPPGRPCTDYDVVSVTVQWLVGRIFLEQMPEGKRWCWSVTSVFMQGMASRGHADTLADAKREFATAWRAWLAKTGETRKRIDRSTVSQSTLERVGLNDVAESHPRWKRHRRRCCLRGR
jgi:hypothetical protein